MRRAAAVGALLVAVLVVEVVAVVLGQRRASAALCGLDVRLRPPVALRVLADRDVPFRVHVDDRDLAVLVPLPAAVSRIRVDDGRVLLDTTLGVTVPAEVELDGGVATITPTLGVLDLDRLAIAHDLAGSLATGVEVHALAVTGDTVVVRGDADVRELTAAGATARCPVRVS